MGNRNLTARICEPEGSALLLPLGGQTSADCSKIVCIPLYMLGLGWCFLGVAIISDVFMGAIERITSRKKRVMNPKTKKYTTVTVWNETIANLTLMALGSSAPEIMLSVIELFGRNFYSGDLGPSTIVGSAAFNLLCIIAVCVSSIPNGEIRKIKDTAVYAVTATFSLVAYTWLIIILTVNSKNIVDIHEAIITFLLFPVLLLIAFCADQGYFSTKDDAKDRATHVITAELGKEELADMELKIRQQHGSDLTESQLARLMELEYMPPVSRAHYRVSAIRHLTGGRHVSRVHSNNEAGPVNRVSSAKDNTSDDRDRVSMNKTGAIIGFASQRYAVLESVGTVRIKVVRKGDMSQRVSIQYKTREGTAKEHTDYEPIGGVLVFQPEEEQQIIEIKIIDDIAYETDEEFYVDLFEPRCPSALVPVHLSDQAECTVLIMDDDEPGFICFENEQVIVPSIAEDQPVPITIQRVNGGSGFISCSYHTEDDTALAGPDYEAAAGTVTFEHGQLTSIINVTVKARGRYASEELFRVVLSKATHGAKFVEDTDGGSDCCILSVIIQAEKETKDKIDNMMTALKLSWSKAQIGHSNWREQFVDAIHVGTGEEGEGPSVFDWVMHVFTLPWKLLFSFVPPTDYCGGWVCFVCSLFMIALVTAVIGDVASLLGCTMDIPDEVTAITFVALGTSLPDTFASKTAAKMDPFADASVGNVTGSNSVNVFLGLGLPWTIGSIYWSFQDPPPQKWIDKYPVEAAKYPNGAFVVPSGTLVFSVIVFSLCAITAILFLAIRRHVVGGELGGEQPGKLGSSIFLFLLWVTYVVVSSWYTLDQKNN